MSKHLELQDLNKVHLDHKHTLINHHFHHYRSRVFMRRASRLTSEMRKDSYNLNPYIQDLELIKFQETLEFIDIINNMFKIFNNHYLHYFIQLVSFKFVIL